MRRMRPLTRTQRLFAIGLAVSCLAALAGTLTAQEAAPPPSPRAVAVYQDAAGFQNNGAYKLAIEEWGKFLTSFPDDPLAPKAQYYLAVCRFQLKDYARAAKGFTDLLQKEARFELAQDARLNLGLCQFALGEQDKKAYQQAVATFDKLIQDFPRGKHEAQALYYRGESRYALGQREEAAKDYQRLLEQFADSPHRADALYALGVTYEELGRHADAGPVYGKFAEEFSNHALAREVRLRTGEVLLQGEEYGKAAEIFADLSRVSEFPLADHALFRHAFCLAKGDKLSDAAARYGELIERFPSSTYIADARLEAGKMLFRAEKFAAAAKWLETSMAEEGARGAEAAHWLCRIHLREQRPDAAQKLAAEALQRAGEGDFTVELKMDLADALYATPDSKRASIDQYAAIAQEHGGHALAPQALYNAAFGAMELADHKLARSLAAQFRSKYAESELAADAIHVDAESALQLGQLQDAAAAYAVLTGKYSDRPEASGWTVRRGVALFLDKQYEAAAEVLAEAVGRLEDAELLAEAQFILGRSYLQQNRVDDAAAALAASLLADDKGAQAAEVLLALARTRELQEKPAEAAAAFRRLVEQFPESSVADRAHVSLADHYAQAGRHEEAASLFKRAIEKWPDAEVVPRALYGLGWSQIRLNEEQAAAASFTRLIDEHPRDALAASARYGRAVSRHRMQEYQDALADLTSYLSSSPSEGTVPDAILLKALCHVGLSDHREAIRTLTAIPQKHPDFKELDRVYYELAWSYASLDQPEAAAKHYRELATRFADSRFAGEARYHVGELLYGRKEFQEALTWYESSVASATPVVREKALYKLGWSHYELGQYDESLAAFGRQVGDFADGELAADGHFMKGESLFRLGQHEEALAAYKSAKELQPSSDAVAVLTLLHGGQSASRAKNLDQAAGYLRELIDRFPDSPHLAAAQYEYGWVQHQRGAHDAALKLYEQAAQSRSEIGARARFMMGELHFAKQEFDEALKQFQRVMYGFGDTEAPPEIKKWQAKATYEAARCADVRIAQASDQQQKRHYVQEALKYYRELTARHGRDPLAKQAGERIAALAPLE